MMPPKLMAKQMSHSSGSGPMSPRLPEPSNIAMKPSEQVPGNSKMTPKMKARTRIPRAARYSAAARAVTAGANFSTPSSTRPKRSSRTSLA